RAGTPLAEQTAWRSRSLSKEIPLEALAVAVRDVRGTLISLQRNPAPGELRQLSDFVGDEIHDMGVVNEDLEEALALLTLLDEYVGVSNTNMHLLAGLGRSGRVLIPNPAEWRWMALGDASPWFPGFSLYRQTISRDWSNAIERLRGDLLMKNEAQCK
ncbi:MAG: hypothetical protein ACO3HA_13505, partial [Burkholderiales bacterium]